MKPGQIGDSTLMPLGKVTASSCGFCFLCLHLQTLVSHKIKKKLFDNTLALIHN